MTSESRSERLREQLQELYGLSCVPLYGTPRNPDRKTYGGKVAQIARAFGTPLMPWQRYVADVALEVDPATGRLAYRDVVLMVPRQSGKTTLLLSKMVWRANAWPRQNILYAAQNRLSARKKWEEEHVAAIEVAKPFRGRFTVRKTNGDEAIRWRNGSRHGITSNTETAGHGETLDDGTIDEAFAHEDGRMEQAFSPAMITRSQPQQWLVSTAGTGKSVFLNGKRTMGRELIEAGQPSTLAFFDWTVPLDEHGKLTMDPGDPATWWSCMPALRHTVTEEAVRSEFTKMDRAEFCRAYLNVTRLDIVEDDPNVPTEQWPALADARSQVGTEIAFALDITPDRQWSSIAVCGPRSDGRLHVEVIDHRPGTDWLVARARELVERHQPVAFGLDIAGPAGSLLVELEKAGLRRPADPAQPERGQLAIPTTREVAAACGAFTDAARQDTLRHRDQAQLNSAIAGARTRPIGDGYAWGRKHSSTDISPLVAATVAMWAHATRAHLVRDDYDPLANIW
ncbi:terminase large subunit domain-containing protein [Saccharopolyspora shandongensis]|uniref:terminase large subunit domain-containing protein n=1 Tax=Saccharopolyspora shandongensis TaxID=418495 RepID=UPI0033E0EC85